MKILIIDDTAQDRKGMGLALERAGFSDLAFAETGEDGLRQAKALNPDVVVIDVVLPQMDGFDVCQQLKEEEGFAAKVLMITGQLHAVDAEKARKSKADEIIEKTESYNNIAQVIKELTGSTA